MNASASESGLIEGPLTIATAKDALARGVQMLDGTDSVVIDLTQVREVDSSALAVMLALTRQAGTMNKKIRFTNIPANLSSLAVLYDVTELLPN